MIKVGEYIRGEDGTIAKVLEIKNEDSDVLNYYCLDNNMGILEKSIVKHSKNIIDIIDVGDYVNGYCVANIKKDKNDKITDICYAEEIEMQLYSVGNIKNIVTKEQFANMEYKVKE